MGMLTRKAYQKMIDEDVEWLRRHPRTLERNHIELVLLSSVSEYYDAPTGSRHVGSPTERPDP